MSSPAAPPRRATRSGQFASWVDDRTGLAGPVRRNLRKVFPDHWSFMLGEIALWSFVIVLVTGVFLTFWYKPSMAEVVYQGSYSELRGLPMSEAFASTLELSFDVRGGLLMRQIHHWAANLFIAAMMVHMLRVFFTGAFRKPRELNWMIGLALLMLGIVTEKNVVGYPMMPVYAAKAGGFFFIVFGVTALMGALLTMNPIWLYGPYNPSQVTAGSQPDWYMGWLDGGLRLMPAWETELFGYTISWNVLVPGLLLLPLLFGLLGAYPFVERWVTGDRREHHLLQRPRNAPTRTALGVAGITAYGVLWIGAGNDIIAIIFNLSINTLIVVLRVLLFVAPVIAFVLTKRICVGLQLADRDRVLHGAETGAIRRLPEGGYVEPHQPLPLQERWRLTAHDRPSAPTANATAESNGVRAPSQRKERLRGAMLRFLSGHDVAKPTREELDEAGPSDESHTAVGRVSEPVPGHRVS